MTRVRNTLLHIAIAVFLIAITVQLLFIVQNIPIDENESLAMKFKYAVPSPNFQSLPDVSATISNVSGQLNLPSKYHKPSHYHRRRPSDGVAACLLLKDENQKLPEWLAYHSAVLPLSLLIVAVDPSSETSPLPILRQWNGTAVPMIIAWTEDKLYVPPDVLKRNSDLLKEHKSDFTITVHRNRQKAFMHKCMVVAKRKKAEWLLHIDVDEYLVFNREDAAGRDPDDPATSRASYMEPQLVMERGLEPPPDFNERIDEMDEWAEKGNENAPKIGDTPPKKIQISLRREENKKNEGAAPSPPPDWGNDGI